MKTRFDDRVRPVSSLDRRQFCLALAAIGASARRPTAHTPATLRSTTPTRRRRRRAEDRRGLFPRDHEPRPRSRPLFGLSAPLRDGERFPLTLRFEHAAASR
ncbi:copper chaperone PCu(A)C [Rubrivivax gelatinosus]|uniref:copper chaperone PCu(A)C n=1 Tax=Rubrivivax gelatinosus TaxID=28068 RepID=UPI001A2D94BD|nr:copper chaperone PCu(A)C [Rubrivivax gelatinosus]MBG6081698.1 hypothetical protein [Rubrivivax gelatinosus]